VVKAQCGCVSASTTNIGTATTIMAAECSHGGDHMSFVLLIFTVNIHLILKPEKLEVPRDSRVLAQVPAGTKTDLDLSGIRERWDSDPRVEFLTSILTSILRLIHGLPRVVFTLKQLTQAHLHFLTAQSIGAWDWESVAPTRVFPSALVAQARVWSLLSALICVPMIQAH
jgi:hypothetical protein